MLIRRYTAADLPALYDVCVRTADGGADARGMYDSDRLMPDLFAGPYLAFEPELCFVLDEGGYAVGYVLGTADTAGFVRRYRQEWIPALAARYPAPDGEPATATEQMIGLHHRPERMLRPELAGFPAHLHIDLLPHVQRQGWGRALLFRFVSNLHEQGVTGVHLSMLSSNLAARRFYDRLGFQDAQIHDSPEVLYLTRSTRPDARS